MNILRKTKSERMVDIVKLFEVSINTDLYINNQKHTSNFYYCLSYEEFLVLKLLGHYLMYNHLISVILKVINSYKMYLYNIFYIY